MKKLLLFIALALVSLFVYQGYLGALNYALDPESEASVVFDVKQGMNAEAIGKALEQKDLIKSASVFKSYLRQNGLADELKAGRIILKENQNLKEIIEALVEGRSEEFTVTLLEGWTISEMADHLESVGLTTAHEFKACAETCEFNSDLIPENYLEGYLHPDSYFVNLATYSDQRFIGRLINNLEIKLTDEDLLAIQESDYTLENIMIMASIVEREERVDSQKAKVAGILWKRYDAGIGLGADATVLYGLGRTKGGLTYEDLQLDSPYNTRKYRGLPPTPIANPGISSIRAAIYPESSPYWYYLHDNDGVIHYATTNDEHNLNKAKYLR